MVPNEITYLNVLTACSHIGQLHTALELLNDMKKGQLSPNVKHYTCIVDTFARLGQLDDAEQFVIQQMRKDNITPNVVTYKTLLSGCRTYKDVSRAEQMFQLAVALDQKDASIYILMANIYASCGKWNEVENLRVKMKELGIKKIPGQSWIEINGKIHSFVVEDKSHPQSAEIYAFLARLDKDLKTCGYMPDTSVVTRDLDEEEKEAHLCFHSERLAVAYGIISLPQTEPIVVTKNLRVCIDCHSVTKAISQIENRELIIRDASRWHHMKNGVCSCKDYW